MKVKTGDNVIVIAGKDKGTKGKVLRVFSAKNKVVVEGVNVVKKHQRPRKSNEKGQIIDRPMPIDASNVAHIDPKNNKPARTGYTVVNGKKERIARKSGAKV